MVSKRVPGAVRCATLSHAANASTAATPANRFLRIRAKVRYLCPMSVHAEFKKVTTHALQEMKRQGEKISMLTAYDYTMALLVDRAGVDVVLVGDSASNVMAGHDDVYALLSAGYTILFGSNPQEAADLAAIFGGCGPALQVVYLHQPADKHEIGRAHV